MVNSKSCYLIDTANGQRPAACSAVDWRSHLARAIEPMQRRCPPHLRHRSDGTKVNPPGRVPAMERPALARATQSSHFPVLGGGSVDDLALDWQLHENLKSATDATMQGHRPVMRSCDCIHDRKSESGPLGVADP